MSGVAILLPVQSTSGASITLTVRSAGSCESKRLGGQRNGRSLVPSLVPVGSAEHGPSHNGPSSLLSGTLRHGRARGGRPDQNTQIYEGTNQIQRVVIARKLLG